MENSKKISNGCFDDNTCKNLMETRDIIWILTTPSNVFIFLTAKKYWFEET